MIATFTGQTSAGFFEAHPDYMEEPDYAWRARIQDKEHVAELYKAFGDVAANFDIVCAVDNDTLYETMHGNKKPTHDELQKMIDKHELNLQALSGDHTCQALRMKAKKFPKQDRWTKVGFHLLVVPSGEKTTRMLLAMSNASNRKNNFIKMQDWVDIIEQIHRQYNQVLSANSKRTKAQVKTALLNFKMDISEQFDIKLPQLGQ